MLQRRIITVALLLVTTLLLAGSHEAFAQTSRFTTGYCTRYAAEQFDMVSPVPHCNWSGDANVWADTASANGWRIYRSVMDAVPNAVVVWTGGGFGHVAIVKSVTPTGITITEMNWGTLTNIPQGITVNFGRQTSTFLAWDKVAQRSHYTFAGYIVPSRVNSLDINGDKQPDIVFRSLWSNTLSYWLLNGPTILSGPAGPFAQATTAEYEICGMPDLNGDGHPDMALRSKRTGVVSAWYLNGRTLVGSPPGNIGVVPLDSVICGFPDLNRDGHPDMVIRNLQTNMISSCYLNDWRIIPGSQASIGRTSSEYVVCGFPDLNGDGYPDIVFRSTVSHLISAWYLQNLTVIGSPPANIGRTSADYVVCGFPDLNADGHPDIVFRSRSSGYISAWYLNDYRLVGSPQSNIGQTSPEWDIVPMY